jgi:hypothetical protein
VPRRFASFAAPAAAVLLAVLVLVSPLRAQPAAGSGEGEALEIRWQGPDDCERGDAVRAKVLRLLGSSRRALAERFQVQVTVRREAPAR